VQPPHNLWANTISRSHALNSEDVFISNEEYLVHASSIARFKYDALQSESQQCRSKQCGRAIMGEFSAHDGSDTRGTHNALHRGTNGHIVQYCVVRQRSGQEARVSVETRSEE
jgi:hypothetical protein